MDHYDLIRKLHGELTNSFADVRVETQLAHALENGLSEDDFVIATDRFFNREYSRDVLHSVIKEDAGLKDYLELHITRRGLYDQLPEGLFFHPGKSLHAPGAATMAGESEKNKIKEQEVRRFFMPFENDFFHQRIQLEREETQLLQGFLGGSPDNYFHHFWDLSTAIHPSLAAGFVKLLPYAHSIAGDPDIMARCLATLLHEPVCVKVSSATGGTPAVHRMENLGDGLLGVDTVMGGQVYDDHPVLEFIIGPLENSQVNDYLEGGGKEEFINAFYRFFAPADADVVTRVEVAKTETELVLGYSSVL